MDAQPLRYLSVSLPASAAAQFRVGEVLEIALGTETSRCIVQSVEPDPGAPDFVLISFGPEPAR